MGAFSDLVNPRSFTILTQPDYIFLCGGRLDAFDYSLRAHFYRDRIQADPDLLKRVQLAEKADEWYQSRSLFSDLLELEEHLAGLSASVLLFVESPGAIAEFGAFSQMALIRDKLVVVMEDSYFRQTSFIRNGLVEYARRNKPGSVLSYPWFSNSPHDPPFKIDATGGAVALDEVEKEIRKILKKKPKTTIFRPDDHGHRMLLIADLVALSVVAVQNDLMRLLRNMGIVLSSSELKKYLFLLEQLSLISVLHFGNVYYYINSTGAPEFVDYAPKTPADRLRLRALLRDEQPWTSKKAKALEAYKRRAGGAIS